MSIHTWNCEKCGKPFKFKETGHKCPHCKHTLTMDEVRKRPVKCIFQTIKVDRGRLSSKFGGYGCGLQSHVAGVEKTGTDYRYCAIDYCPIYQTWQILSKKNT